MDLISPVLELFQVLPPWLIVLILSAAPVIGLLGSIPVAINLYGMNPIAAVILAIAGNIIPIFLFFSFLEPVSIFLSRRSKFFEKFFDRLFRGDYKGNRREIYKGLALAVFVALPLPLTGAWAATVLSLVLKYNPRAAFISIFAGVIAAGIIVTILTVSGILVWD
jgi:uncharacterized membrane protein